ncbi:hypothetical protein WZ342_1747 [Enterococcus faecalis]|nr:hypothetical protein WZ342_1747 [Enterococcus faecalis]
MIKVKILFLLTGSGETVNTPNKSGIVHTIPLLFFYIMVLTRHLVKKL